MNQVLQGDCLEVMRSLPDNSIDLICTDPPYFKAKQGQCLDSWWDNQWDKPVEFLKWIDKLAEQWQRILKPNGSVYCFASHRMSARVEVQLSEYFNILTRITWNKGELPTGGRHKSCSKEGLRSFFPASESIIFCEHYGADNVAKGEAGYEQKCDEALRDTVGHYIREIRKEHGLSAKDLTEVVEAYGTVNHGGACSNWENGKNFPTPDHYAKLQQAFPGYFQRPYEELRSQYEELRSQYEDLRSQYEELRRPFNVTADVPYTDVWTFPTVQAYAGKHPCEKPLAMLEHIITASSRPNAIVLDCFAGSGSTLVAAKKLGREYIGIEIDPHWISQCHHRLGDFTVSSISLEQRVTWLETQAKAQSNKIKKIETGQLSLFSAIGNNHFGAD